MCFDELCRFVWFMQLPCCLFCSQAKQPPEDGCMKPKHVVEEEEENKELHIYGPT
jgi:hypothetical protein